MPEEKEKETNIDPKDLSMHILSKMYTNFHEYNMHEEGYQVLIEKMEKVISNYLEEHRRS